VVTEMDVKNAIRKLAVAFTRPEGSEDDLVGLWRHVLDGVDGDALREAVSRYLRSDSRFFPKPGQIRTMCLEIAAESYGERQERPRSWNSLQEGPCPVCGASLRLAGDPNNSGEEVFDVRSGKWRKRRDGDHEPPLRFRVIHNGHAHRAAGIPAVGDVTWGRA